MKMLGINEVLNYIRFLRRKEELERLIKKHILITKPKCSICGFEYNTIEDIHKKLPIVGFNKRREYVFVCNKCRKQINKKIT